jgi:hypothetical protein
LISCLLRAVFMKSVCSDLYVFSKFENMKPFVCQRERAREFRVVKKTVTKHFRRMLHKVDTPTIFQ